MQCGICQKELFGVTESPEGLTVCGSCVMAPLPPRPEDDLDKAQVDEFDSNVDLSYLDQKGQRERTRSLLKEGKSVNQVRMDLGQLSLQEPVPLQEKPVKKLKLKSNSVRDRMHPVGSLMLRFDGEGVAEFAECHLEEVKAHMALRPGRFRIMDESPSEQKKDPSVALDEARAALEAARAESAASVEPEPEPVKEPAPEPEPAPKQEQPKAKPKAKKKTTRKKKSSVRKNEAD